MRRWVFTIMRVIVTVASGMRMVAIRPGVLVPAMDLSRAVVVIEANAKSGLLA